LNSYFNPNPTPKQTNNKNNIKNKNKTNKQTKKRLINITTEKREETGSDNSLFFQIVISICTKAITVQISFV
jgi:beta-lactamase regulating signal transducer with metallopeptidase domain